MSKQESTMVASQAIFRNKFKQGNQPDWSN